MAVWSNTALSTIETQFGRFDAEFYRPEFLDTDRSLSSIDGVKLRGVASKIDVGHVGPMVRHYSEAGVLLLQTQNVREFFLDLGNSVRVTPEFHASLIKSQVHRGDILIARSGSFGSAAIYLEDSVVNSADVIIVQIDDPRVNALYAVTFMNTRYGSAQLVRFASGGVQGHVNLRILEHFRIPILDEVEQERIAEIVQAAYVARMASAESYAAAQQLLESELGLDALIFQKPVSYTAQFSEVRSSLRADSEYFNPVAAALVERTTSFDHVRLGASFSVGNGFPWQSKRFLDDNSGEPVVRIRNIRPSHIDIDDLTSIEPNYAERVGFSKARKGDLVVGMDGLKYFFASILEGDCYVNQRVAHLVQKAHAKISPEYATFVVNSRIGQAQLLRDMTIATTVGHITNRNIASLVLPYVSDAFHEKITSLVRSSIDKQQESRQLLEIAKNRVEQIIEEAVQP